ncbi:MAG: transcription termination/antitermination factor NusG [Cytophagales bacterium]|jgi:transcriptional antiterminator NusG|nr:transcription termination/antitermination factor NusG [Cytophagales bacterium]
MESSFPWYTLKVTSGQEFFVKSWLLRERDTYKVTDSFVDAVSPCEKKIVIQNGKKISKSLLVYSGYVFVNADISNEKVLEFLKRSPKSWGLVGPRGSGFSKKPIPLKDEEVIEILKIVDNLQVGISSLEENVKFFVGEKVRVVEGPFVDFTGVIHEVYEDCKKLNVMINVFSRSTPVELNFAQVAKF